MNKCHIYCLAASVAISVTTACDKGPWPTSPANPSPAVATPTITISDAGVSPTELIISVGQQVRFVNNSSQTHEMRSVPHPVHTDCPPINALPALSAGQSGLTAALTLQGTCGFHDHRRPTDQGFRGVILVGTSESGGSPEY